MPNCLIFVVLKSGKRKNHDSFTPFFYTFTQLYYFIVFLMNIGVKDIFLMR